MAAKAKTTSVEVNKGDAVMYVNAQGEKNVALVAKVLNTETGSVNLAVFDEDGNASNAKSVEFLDVNEAKHEKLTPNTWHFAE